MSYSALAHYAAANDTSTSGDTVIWSALSALGSNSTTHGHGKYKRGTMLQPFPPQQLTITAHLPTRIRQRETNGKFKSLGVWGVRKAGHLVGLSYVPFVRLGLYL